LIFGETRRPCNITPEGPTQIALAEFRVIAEHIGTRDLVQKFLAFKVFPTMKEWAMPKLEGKKKEGELIRWPYHYKFKRHFKVPCQEWLDTIEVMCNEILGNYSKKEDQLMTAAFCTRPKRRLNRVMDALGLEGTSATPSATEVEEILKVMTESLPVKLSPLGPHLTKLFQKGKGARKNEGI
jgi:hypothetical protein